MKKLLIVLGAALVGSPVGFGAPLQSARVTKIVNDVRVFHPSASARVAKEGDVVGGKSSVQTGRRSRSELRFQDDTITRLGSNSIFSFEQSTRDLRLEQGAILLTVPKNAGGARIRTATVTAAVTGTSIMMEYNLKKWVKIIVLEGSLVTWIEKNGKQSRQKTIKAGQMVVLKAGDARMPNPADVDLARIMQTAGLIDPDTFGPLPLSAQNRIADAVNQQSTLKNQGRLVRRTIGSVGTGFESPAGGGSSPGEQSSSTRELVIDNIPPIEVDDPREGDDPGGPPPGGNPPGEGDDP